MAVANHKSFTAASIYLCIYNLFLCLGWTILMLQFVNHMVSEGSIVGLWNATSVSLMLFQSLAILEVLHCIVGIVRSNALLTFCQVFSRLFLTWAILYGVPVSRTSVGFPMVLLAWSLTEMVRYFYYFLGLLDSVPHLLTFLRYTMFIVLYPLGVAGEMTCYFAALPLVKQSRALSVEMPNKINFTFDSYYAFLIIIILYLPVFPRLYFHMLAQRRKMLHGNRKTE